MYKGIIDNGLPKSHGISTTPQPLEQDELSVWELDLLCGSSHSDYAEEDSQSNEMYWLTLGWL